MRVLTSLWRFARKPIPSRVAISVATGCVVVAIVALSGVPFGVNGAVFFVPFFLIPLFDLEAWLRTMLTLGWLIALFALGELLAPLSPWFVDFLAFVWLTVFVFGPIRAIKAWGQDPRLRFITTNPRLVTISCWAVLGFVLFTGTAYLFVPGGESGQWAQQRGGLQSLYVTLAVLALILFYASLWVRILGALLNRLLPRVGQILRPEGTLASAQAALALGSVAFLGAAIFAGTFYSGLLGIQRSYDTNFVQPGTPNRPLSSATDSQILMGLAPVLTVSGKSDWHPQRVDPYLRGAQVFDSEGKIVLPPHSSVDELPALSSLCSEEKPCYRVVNAGCPMSEDCRARTLGPDQTLEDMVGYGHVLRRSNDPRVSWDASPFGQELIGIAQWWLFTPYNEWNTSLTLIGGSITQSHAADWEHVTIGFGEQRVLFVALSAHCGGSWRRFENVNVGLDLPIPTDFTPLGRSLHPLVASAHGSHAMYFEPGNSRSPDSLGCYERELSGWLRSTAFTLNAWDVTSDAIHLRIWPVPESEAKKVLEFPAMWALTSRVTLAIPFLGGNSERGSLEHPDGPESPSLKDAFADPVKEVFCTGSWHEDGTRTYSRAACKNAVETATPTP